MPFDLIGWGEAAPGTGTLGTTALLGDSLYASYLDDIILNSDITKLLGIFAAAVSTGGVSRIRQPGLDIDHHAIKCMLETDIDPTQGFTSLLDNPLPLVPGEKCNALMANATDESRLIGLMVGNKKLPRACNPTHMLHGIGDTTLTALTWTECAMTWLEDLPAGKYAIVGMRAGHFKSATPLAAIARLVIPGAQNWRPGVPSTLMEADHEEFQSQTDEPWWIWGLMPEVAFSHNRMPNVEYASGAAHTDQNVDLLLQKVAG